MIYHSLISPLLPEIKKTAKEGAASPVGDYIGSVIYINVLYSQIDEFFFYREFASSYNVSRMNIFGIFSLISRT